MYRTGIPDSALEALDRLLENLAEMDDDELTSWYDGLNGLFEKLKGRREIRQEAYRAYRRTYRREIEAREVWIKAYRRVKTALMLVFDQNREMVQAFFWKEPRSPKKDAPEVVESEDLATSDID